MRTVSLWMQVSLDGFTEGPRGEFDWPIVDEKLHRYFIDELRPMDAFMYGRKVYDLMAAYCENLADELATLKEEPGHGIVLFGGADIASTFMRLDLIDEYRLFVHPVVLGGGTPLFPASDRRVNLRLVQARTFDSAVVHLHYQRVLRQVASSR